MDTSTDGPKRARVASQTETSLMRGRRSHSYRLSRTWGLLPIRGSSRSIQKGCTVGLASPLCWRPRDSFQRSAHLALGASWEPTDHGGMGRHSARGDGLCCGLPCLLSKTTYASPLIPCGRQPCRSLVLVFANIRGRRDSSPAPTLKACGNGGAQASLNHPSQSQHLSTLHGV